MPFAEFCREQIGAIEGFLGNPGAVIRRVLLDGEMRPILLKMLVGRNAEADFPHVLLGFQAAFTDPVTWFGGLQNALEAELAEHGTELVAEGVDISDYASDVTKRGPWPFLLRAERLSRAMPGEVGALAFLLDPVNVQDPDGYLKSIAFLAENVRSGRLKFIVLEDRQAPTLAALEPSGLGAHRVSGQVFWASPNELEARVNARLTHDAALGNEEREKLLLMAASFAFANRDYARAEALQRAQLASPAMAPLQKAIGLYGLGNTLLAGGRPEEAADALLDACVLCNENDLREFAPMTYTNLGFSLHRLGRFDEAFGSLRVASNLFRAQGNRPGEAFVCDNLANMYLELGHATEAARVWRYALGLYEGIANPALADIREAGRVDLNAKLERVKADA